MGKASLVFGHGCAISRDIAYMSGFLDALDDEVKFTRLVVLSISPEVKWFSHDLGGHTVMSVCLRKATSTQERAACALTEEGLVEFAGRGGIRTEQIQGPGFGPGTRDLGMMARIREVGAELFACGASNQLYARRNGQWQAIDQPLTAISQATTTSIVNKLRASKGQVPDDLLLEMTEEMADAGGLDGLGGSSENDLYVCGLGGRLWHWDGHKFERVEVPTSDYLHDVHAVSAEKVYVCGHNGTLLRGNKKDGFKSLIGPENTTNFWSVREFDDKVYLGTADGLFAYSAIGVHEIPLPRAMVSPIVNGLDTIEDALWVFTERFVVRYCEGRWERFDHPDNKS